MTTQQYQTISIDEFDKKYQPIQNHNPETQICENGDGIYQGFETYGVDLEFVQKAYAERPRSVWTLIDSDEGNSQIITNRFALCNRICYFITANTYEAGEIIDVIY